MKVLRNDFARYNVADDEDGEGGSGQYLRFSVCVKGAVSPFAHLFSHIAGKVLEIVGNRSGTVVGHCFRDKNHGLIMTDLKN